MKIEITEIEVWANPTPEDGVGVLLQTLTKDDEFIWDEYATRVLDAFMLGGEITPTIHDCILMLPRSGSFDLAQGDTWAQTGAAGTDGWERSSVYSPLLVVDPYDRQRITLALNGAYGGRLNFNSIPPTYNWGLAIGVSVPNADFATWGAGNYPKGIMSHAVGTTALAWGASWTEDDFTLSAHADNETSIVMGGSLAYQDRE